MRALCSQIRLSDVTASGKDGRVLKEDILRHIGSIDTPATKKKDGIVFQQIIQIAVTSTAVSAAKAPPAFTQLTADRVVPIRGYTKAMVRTMTEANKIPHFGYNDEVNTYFSVCY